jgi:hypothetical protein
MPRMGWKHLYFLVFFFVLECVGAYHMVLVIFPLVCKINTRNPLAILLELILIHVLAWKNKQKEMLYLDPFFLWFIWILFCYFLIFLVLLNRYVDGHASALQYLGVSSGQHAESLYRRSDRRRNSKGQLTALLFSGDLPVDEACQVCRWHCHQHRSRRRQMAMPSFFLRWRPFCVDGHTYADGHLQRADHI